MFRRDSSRGQINLTVDENRANRYFDICYNDDGTEVSVNIVDCLEVEMAVPRRVTRSRRTRHRQRCVMASERMAISAIGAECGTVS